ncbi:YbaB/EbfC family nucleoid-associated protein [Amycolatopsis sp. NBC_01480]|uniref:YbaB/EbfC family nucleoid-associated protein n=1 Tax=Amycolatopsis sp. NBC_01480 TaxID=2903562 RepID=UPI002E2E5DCB|nr:YbaB/EbfC family nucleoid-associated protein [Amycolatopsis sp. NBC_01480]
MPDSIDASQQMVDGWTRQLKETAARYQAMAERMQGQTVTERSKDGLVEVTVDAKGLLKNLVIAESANGKRMAEVSALVMQLVQKAQSRIPELLQQAAAETVGGDGTTDALVEKAKGSFPAPPEEPAAPEPDHGRRFIPEDTEPPPPPPPAPPRQQAPPPPPPPPRRRRSQPDDDDDNFGGPILS